jgi:hypothetical protein
VLTGRLGSLGQPVLKAKARGHGDGSSSSGCARLSPRRARPACMKPFDLREPDSLQEAVALLDPDDPATRPIAGGTALMLMMKAGVFQPRRLVSLRRIARQYSGISETDKGEISLGAMATLTALARSPLVRQKLPVVAECLPALSNVRVATSPRWADNSRTPTRTRICRPCSSPSGRGSSRWGPMASGRFPSKTLRRATTRPCSLETN